MDPTIQQWRYKIGDQVVSADDHKIGKVVRILPDVNRPTHLIVEKGRLIHHDYQIPVDAVSNYENGTIYLRLTEEASRNAGWNVDNSADTDSASEEYIG
jgi:rRNA processing protein Gar1